MTLAQQMQDYCASDAPYVFRKVVTDFLTEYTLSEGTDLSSFLNSKITSLESDAAKRPIDVTSTTAISKLSVLKRFVSTPNTGESTASA